MHILLEYLRISKFYVSLYVIYNL